MTDYVSIRELRVPAVIGVHDWEREIEQTLIFNVDMAADVRKPGASDDIADALDYSAVAGTISAVVRKGKFRLIETAAERVAARLLADHRITWLRLELRKPIATDGYTAVITIDRSRENLDGEDIMPRSCRDQETAAGSSTDISRPPADRGRALT